MIDFIIGERGSGTTTRLINWCKENNGLYLANKIEQLDTIKKEAGVSGIFLRKDISKVIEAIHAPIAVDNLLHLENLVELMNALTGHTHPVLIGLNIPSMHHLGQVGVYKN